MSLNKNAIGSLDKTIDMTVDTLNTGNITLAGDIVPDGDDTRSLGATGKDFLKIWNNDADALAVPCTPANHTIDKHTDVQRKMFYPSPTTGSTANPYTGKELPDANDTSHWSTIKLPDDFVSIVSFKPVVVPAGTGNVRWEIEALSIGTDNDDKDTHTDTKVAVDEAVVNDQIEFLGDCSSLLSAADTDDLIGIRFRRIGTHANDTIGASVTLLGWLLVYTAEQ